MGKTEFIKKFNLYKSPLKAVFPDGRTAVTRRLYFQKGSDTCFIFYMHDLAIFEKDPNESISNAYDTGYIYGHTVAYYGWYH